jgi:hypothetical protein
VGRHHLDTPATGGLVPLVRRLSGVHAQLASAAEAAVRLRTGGRIGPDDVRRALAEDRTLVKTWAVRGTLHLLPAEDLPLWSAALGTRSFPRPQSWYRYHEVTADDMAAIEETVPEVLSDPDHPRAAGARGGAPDEATAAGGAAAVRLGLGAQAAGRPRPARLRPSGTGRPGA